tara:strand:+ start:15 stop:503 length:489 start_codon:yes stop_codon:yes gene_type:complete
MENLQELVGQIEEIKDKITDKQYKDILELTQKINEEKDIGKFIKVKRLTFKTTVAYQQEFNNNIINNTGNNDTFGIGTKCCNDDDCDCNHEEKIISLQGRHSCETIDLILKVVEKVKKYSWGTDLKDTGIENEEIALHTYERIKRDILWSDGQHNYIFIKDM